MNCRQRLVFQTTGYECAALLPETDVLHEYSAPDANGLDVHVLEDLDDETSAGRRRTHYRYNGRRFEPMSDREAGREPDVSPLHFVQLVAHFAPDVLRVGVRLH
jgi:hypothetical protein